MANFDKIKRKKKNVKKTVKKEKVISKPTKPKSDEITIHNKFGVTKYLDEEEYKKVSEQIKTEVDRIAKRLKWNKYTYEVTPEVIIIKKE